MKIILNKTAPEINDIPFSGLGLMHVDVGSTLFNQMKSTPTPICGIYKITSPSGRIYIGQSTDINNRLKYYKKARTQGQTKIRASLNKHGFENHKFEIIETCDKEHLNYYEIYYIRLFNTFNSKHGMNLTAGGPGMNGFKPKIKTRKLLSKSTKGKNNPFYGKTHSEETIKIIVAANLGKKQSQETKEKRKVAYSTPEARKRAREKRLGKKHSSETILKIKAYQNDPSVKEKKKLSQLGKKQSPETIEKRRRAHLGKTISQETKLKISKANTGKKKSQTSIENMSYLVLNTQNGIFYAGIKNAAEAVGMEYHTLKSKLNGARRNNTYLTIV